MTETEKAMSALAAALNASAALPVVRRDPVFDDVLESLSVTTETFGRALVMRHGSAVDTTRRFGAGPEAFELVRNAEIEWFVSGLEGSLLNATFDDGVAAIFSAIEADPTLGGNVVLAEIVEQPEIGTEPAGGRAVLTALIRVDITYVSPRAY